MKNIVYAVILVVSALSLFGVINTPWQLDMVIFFVTVAMICTSVRTRKGES